MKIFVKTLGREICTCGPRTVPREQMGRLLRGMGKWELGNGGGSQISWMRALRV